MESSFFLKMKSRNWFYYLLLTASAVLWGSSFIFTKRLLDVADPVVIICSRVMIAGPFFLLLCLLFFRKDMRIARKDLPILFAFSCFEPFLYFIFETYSLTHCDASVVSRNSEGRMVSNSNPVCSRKSFGKAGVQGMERRNSFCRPM